MSQLRSTQHANFVIERAYLAPPSRLFAAWATADAKARWCSGPADRWTLKKRELDFRVGGRELLVGGFSGGPVATFDSRFQDIGPSEGIVYNYVMRLDD